MKLLIILSNFCLVYSKWYLGEAKQPKTARVDAEDASKRVDTEDASKHVLAHSPTECILKCKRQLKKGFYVEKKSQCFCLKNEEQKIYASENNTGFLYHQIEDTPLSSCKEVKENCPTCTSDFYSLERDCIMKKVFCEFTADGVEKPSCKDIRNNCPTCETNFYNIEMPSGEQVNLFCKIENGAVVDGTCKSINEICPSCPSQLYLMESNDIFRQIFCQFSIDGVGEASCNDIKKQCPTCETHFYITELPTEVQKKIFCKIEKGAVVDGSCKAIKEICPGCQSGFFFFEMFAQNSNRFCDMNVDGGGWLAVGNVTLTSANQVAGMLTSINTGYRISKLNQIQNGKFMLSNSDIRSLFKNRGYTEVRVKCFKPYHGRTLHVKFSGNVVYKWLVNRERTLGVCGSAQFFGDDNSKTSKH
eukprot:TCONS_00067604-protein